MHAQQAQAGAHHQRVGLADVIRGFAGRQLDRGDQRAAGGDDALLGRAGQVGVGRDQARALVDQIDRFEDGLVVVGVGLARDNVVRVHVVHHDAGLVQRADQAGRADDIGGSAGLLAGDELRGRERGGVKMLLADLKPHARQLLLELERRALGRVGQEKEALVFLLEPFHKFRHTLEQTVAVIDDTVHIADKALFRAQQFKFLVHIPVFSPFGCILSPNPIMRTNRGTVKGKRADGL